MSRWAFSVLGLRIDVEKSIENDLEKKPIMFMSTHGSFLDVLVFINLYKNALSFPTKADLFKIPLLKNILNVGYCIPIDWENLD